MMMITFFIVGLMAAGFAWWLIRLSLSHGIKGWPLAGLAVGFALILFCIAWGMGSVLEGVPRAAAMGVVFFGFPGVVLLTLVGRYVTGSIKQG
jgi:hypothetical protein